MCRLISNYDLQEYVDPQEYIHDPCACPICKLRSTLHYKLPVKDPCTISVIDQCVFDPLHESYKESYQFNVFCACGSRSEFTVSSTNIDHSQIFTITIMPCDHCSRRTHSTINNNNDI